MNSTSGKNKQPEKTPRAEKKLAGFCESLAFGSGFLHVAGWIAYDGKDAVAGPLRLQVASLPAFPIHALQYRRDIETFGVQGGLSGFSALVKSAEHCGEVAAITVILANDEQYTLPLLKGAFREFHPKGQFHDLTQSRISGQIFDADAWIAGRTAEIRIDDDISIPVPATLDDRGIHAELAGDFGCSAAERLPPFALSIDAICRIARQQDAGRNLLDGLAHRFTLISSCKEIATRDLVLHAPGKGRLERVTGGDIVGWAVPLATKQAVEVEILWNDVLYTTVKAALDRQDLIDRGVAHSGGGFKCTLAAAPDDSGVGEVTARIKYSPTPLPAPAPQMAHVAPFRSQLATMSKDAVGGGPRDVAIIIPIYNAAEDLGRCLQALGRNTTWPARLILIDDASSDPAVSAQLAGWRDRPHVSVTRHDSNAGYTATINEGITLAADCDVVLLNSDTMVGPFWLQQLRLAAYSGPAVATATALSNNSGAFSIPEQGTNAWPTWMSPDDCARTVAQAAGGLYPCMPTGNGFCMFIRRTCIDAIGLFDEKAFPRGYGEENDFCMRALRADFTNVIDDRTFVQHTSSASFGDEKQALLKSGLAVMAQRYPEYATLIATFSAHPAMLSIRWRARHALKVAVSTMRLPLPRILYVISTPTGGTPQTNQDLMEQVSDRYECWLLRCDSRVIELSRFAMNGNNLVEKLDLQVKLQMSLHRSEEYNRLVHHILLKYAFELVHIRHIAWHGLDLPKLCARIGIPCIFSFHDFYTICPTVKLLDDEHKFCNGNCTASGGDCRAELWPSGEQPRLKHAFITRWQDMMSEALAPCDAFVTTSPFAAGLIDRKLALPAAKTITIIPHGRTFAAMASAIATPDIDGPLRILLPGNIDAAKGSAICTALLDAGDGHDIEFHALGDPGDLTPQPGMILHGLYARGEFLAKVRDIRPHVGVVFSIWPETYCHTLTEMWAGGVPVIAFDLGAVGERIREHGGGWLLPVDTPVAEIHLLFARIRRDAPEFVAKCEEIAKWQATYGTSYDAAAMGHEYDLLYRRVLRRKRAFSTSNDAEPSETPAVLVISPYLPHGDGHGPASTHIRIAERTRNAADRPIQYRHSRSSAPVTTPFGSPVQAVLVQRDIIRPADVDGFIRRCQDTSIKIIVDCDDDLMKVPADKDVDERYSNGAEAFRRLIVAADLVLVSTEVLASCYRAINSHVRLLPNILSARLWQSPLAPKQASSASGDVRALYMGTATHDADLAILREPIGRLKSKYPNFKLCVVGGQRSNEDWFERLDGPETPVIYTPFVPWFRAVAADMDFALGALAETDFNACKSDLKFLDYSAAGLAGIYSDVPAYRQIVEQQSTGILTDNSPNSWFECMDWMISNPAERHNIAKRARRLVLESRTSRRPGSRLDEEIGRLLER